MPKNEIPRGRAGSMTGPELESLCARLGPPTAAVRILSEALEVGVSTVWRWRVEGTPSHMADLALAFVIAQKGMNR